MSDTVFHYDDKVSDLYRQLSNDTAYNKEALVHSADAGDGMGAIAAIFEMFPGFEDQAAMLRTHQTGAAQLTNHMTTHFDNLTTNLSVMSSYISDMQGVGVMGADGTTAAGGSAGGGAGARMSLMSAAASSGGKCASMGDAFGSIMGQASSLLGQATPNLGQMAGLAMNTLGGGILQSIGNIPGMSNIISGIGSVGSLAQIGSAISQAAQSGNLGGLAGMLNASTLGQIGSSLSNLGNMIGLGNVDLSGLSQITGALGQVSGLLGNLSSGNIGGILNSLGSGPMGQLTGAIGQALGGVSGVMGQVAGMIGKELGALGGAMNALKALAGAINLPSLAADSCASSVLASVGSAALKATLGLGSGGGGGGGGGSPTQQPAVPNTNPPQKTVPTIPTGGNQVAGQPDQPLPTQGSPAGD